MLINILLNMISTTMIFMFVYTFVGFFQLDKKNSVIKSVQDMLDGFFKPMLSWLRKTLPQAKVDYSGMAFVIILWILYRILFMMQ